METSPITTRLKKIAFGLGILEGLAYAVLAIICIVLHNQDIRYLYPDSYWGIVNGNMYYMFLAPRDSLWYDFYNYTLVPPVFTGFAWFYLILHFGWVCISVEGLRRSRGVNLHKYLSAWSYLTILICVWDFITVVILGVDYGNCLVWAGEPWDSDKIGRESICSTGIMPVLVIAAKGFVLWIVNLIFAIVFLKIPSKLKQGTVYRQPPASAPIGFQQHFAAAPHNIQPPQPHRPTPYVMQSPQNLNRNQFDYPVYIPEPDYNHTNQQPNSPRRHY